jgi:diguanylate cyclase (GGDEF)-like protein/PAS domain S-box-containing protein
MNVISTEDSAALVVALGNGLTQGTFVAGEYGPRLLLVDDEPMLLNSLCELLKGRGYQLVTASSGSEAIRHLEKTKFDLALLDLRLPDYSGHEIMDVINTRGIDTKVIVLSGDTGIDAAIGALKRGAYDYLRKPHTREELLTTVDNALKQKRLENENHHIAWQLECSEKLYRYLVDSSPDIIYTLNGDGRFTFINDRVQQLLGFSPAELIGKHYSELVHDEDLERARYVFNERRVGQRASRNVELRLKSNLGNELDLTFENTLMTISFNSMGMYAVGADPEQREFFGTYGVARDVTERKRAEAMISYQAYHDILTDLPNRVLFKDRLGLAVIQAKRNRCGLAVMFIDLDRFKLVNDTLGHVKGDELLQQVATRLKNCLRRGDTLARLGGDEFTVVLPELREKNDAKVIAEKFLETFRLPFVLEGSEFHISASIGISIYPEDGESIDELLRHADMAMYHVKAQGKNGHAFYEEAMYDATYREMTLEKSIRRALEQNQLVMYYQPQVDVATGCISGAEALIRWNHPERGVLSPGEFLPFAEEHGLMIPITDWMLQAVCKDMRDRAQAGLAPIRISMNVSPQYLDRGDFAERMRQVLPQYGIPPEQIEVEITENICIRNPQHVNEQLTRLCQIGVSVAIDDFGTGYSSLSYLHRFPIHTVKIDQSFVKEIQREDGHFPVVLAIISIAKGLGLNLIAEGVESELQARYLESCGCSTMQGYHFFQPIPARTLFEILNHKQAACI